MTAPRLDQDSDDVLAPEIRAELDAFVARHRHEPPLGVLRAADADVLPPELQAHAARALAASAWSRQVVAGAHDAADEASLSDEETDALLARIRRQSTPRAPSPFRRNLVRFLIPAVAAAAVVTFAVLNRPSPTPATPAATPAAPAPPAQVALVFHIPVEPAAIKLTTGALTRRSPGQGGVFTNDAAPAFTAYRAGRYAEAATAFAALAQSYPLAPEAEFYLGVSRLLADDAAGAAVALRAARRIDDPTFRDDVAWYLSAADERIGNAPAARDELTRLCRGPSAFAARACDAAAKLPAK